LIPVSIPEERIPLLHGANGKFIASLDVGSTADPFPVSPNAIAKAGFSADGKTTLGNDIALGLSAGTSVTLAAVFKEETRACSDLVKMLELDEALSADNLMMVLDVGGNATLSASGSYKYNILSATVSLDAGADARLVNTRIYKDRKQPSGAILHDFLDRLVTPGSVREPLLPGQTVYLEFGGYLSFGASLAAGYEMKGTHDFQSVRNLELSETYKLSVTGKLSVSAKLAGRFSVEARSADDLHSDDPGWVRVTVKRRRAEDLRIAADLSAGAAIDTVSLPPTGKEFLGSLLGLRAKNWINQAASILGGGTLDGLANIYMSRYMNKAVDSLPPAELSVSMEKLSAVVESYKSAGDSAVTLFDRYFDRIDRALKPALEAIGKSGSLDEFHGEIDAVLWNVLQQLTGGNLLQTILDRSNGLKTLKNAAAKVLDLIDGEAHKEIRAFIAISKKEFDFDNIIGELAGFDTLEKLRSQASAVANHVAERILGKSAGAWTNSDFGNLTAFVKEVQKGAQGFFDKFDNLLEEAAGQKFTAEIGLAYDRADEREALIDVDIRLQNADGRPNDRGLAFMAQAGLGNFTDILLHYDPAVLQLREGSLTHRISSIAGAKVNIAGWHRKFRYQSLYSVVVNADRQIRPAAGGMLHVFTTVDMSAGHDLTRKTSRHEQAMHSNFTLRFIAECTVPTLTDDDRKYLLEVITATAATYKSRLIDNNTTPEKLDRILSFAKQLGLDARGANVDALAPVLQLNAGNYGPVNADYAVRFSELGLRNLFSAGTVDAEAIRGILRTLIVSSYAGKATLEQVAWLYCSDAGRELFADNPVSFANSETLLANVGDLRIRNPFPTLKVNVQDMNTFLVRTLAAALFGIERNIINAFTMLQDGVQGGNITLDRLEQASRHFGDALNSFDEQAELCQGTSNPIFAVFDHLIQLATPAAQARNSAVTLKLGPDVPAEKQKTRKTLLFQLVSEPPEGKHIAATAN
jgi:hypothetical protein